MSMFLTPDLKPFYGATYIPPKAKYGRSGFEDVITQIHEVWINKEKDVIESGEKIVNKLNELISSRVETTTDLSKELFENAFTAITKIYDDEYGGFGSGNKFPRPVVYNFLLDYFYHTKEFSAIDMVTFTLKKCMKAECMIICREDFTAILWIHSGEFLILKRCYMIRRN